MIAAIDLTKKFGEKRALDAISCSIPSGSVFGLIGSNGAGKSTLLRTIAGVYRADGGELTVDGASPFENPGVKGRLFFVPDFPCFFPQATLRTMARFYSLVYPHWDSERYHELCGIFPIGETDKLANMSKGMQRQALIILALSTRPDYLLLDEIFDGLDPVIRQLVKRLLAEEVGVRGASVVIASHNLRELEDVCDHIGLMHRGGILLERELDELKLGIHKVQAAFLPAKGREDFSALDLVSFEARGSLVSLVARGDRDQIVETLERMSPVFLEALPLTLEEVFISEMEVAGYDLENILR